MDNGIERTARRMLDNGKKIHEVVELTGLARERVLELAGIKDRYKRLKINFDIPEELEEAIVNFLHHVNFEYGYAEDYHRAEILNCLNEARKRNKINDERYKLLYDYYVMGGIYKEKGKPDNFITVEVYIELIVDALARIAEVKKKYGTNKRINDLHDRLRLAYKEARFLLDDKRRAEWDQLITETNKTISEVTSEHPQ